MLNKHFSKFQRIAHDFSYLITDENMDNNSETIQKNHHI